MFTGITEETGRIVSISRQDSSLALTIDCSFAGKLAEGESVAVNGTCLTVTSKTQNSFTADVTPETFRRTSLGQLEENSKVNLERAMKADGRFGGHIVSGHIDTTGKIISFSDEGNAVNIRISVPAPYDKYIIEKGSVCIDGISLTVAQVNAKNSSSSRQTEFSVAVIPHTWKNTTLSFKNSGDTVNIECDIVGKYIEHFLSYQKDGIQSAESITDSKTQNSQDAEKTDESSLIDFIGSVMSFH
jgi:riboflavin synthase